MISARRLAQLAKKWQRKRLTMAAKETEDCCTCPSVAIKGHCVMYTADGRRFEVPLPYLTTAIFSELLKVSQEEFGFARDGKITLPCDATLMEYAMSLLRRNASAELEMALLSAMVTSSYHSAGCVVPAIAGNQQSICCM